MTKLKQWRWTYIFDNLTTNTNTAIITTDMCEANAFTLIIEMKLNLNVYNEQFRSDIKSYECIFIKRQCQCDADFNLIYFIIQWNETYIFRKIPVKCISGYVIINCYIII